jgi:hypothetical protein
VGARPLLAGLVAGLALAAPAGAQTTDPGRLKVARIARVPAAYNQGLAALPNGAFAFSGTFALFRTGADLRQTARLEPAIPEDVGRAEGYNHIGDIAYDPGEGGRLLLPLECYTVSGPTRNPCGTGSFGVADPNTLQWRYHVKLDPAFIKKAMWVERSPDGALLWTQAGRDLLAYRTAEVVAQNQTTLTPEGPRGIALRPARRLRGVAPDGYTGAAFYRGRLYGAVDRPGLVEVWSHDLRPRGRRRLEVRRPIVGESEGLTAARRGGGVLQWLVTPAEVSTEPPTFGTSRSVVLSLSPAARRARARAGR